MISDVSVIQHCLLLGLSSSNAALVTFVVYSAVVMGLAIFSHRVLANRSFLAEYFLGSRNLGVWAFMLTFAATSASAGSFAGFPARVYTQGWVIALYIAGYMTVPLIGIGLLGKRINRMARQANAITLPELLDARFRHPAVIVISTCMIVFLLSFYLIPQFKLASIILQSLLTDVPLWQSATHSVGQLTQSTGLLAKSDPEYLLGLFVFSITVIVYTSVGGFRAVVWTDVLQGIVMFFGVLLLLLLVVSQAGGLQNATKKIAEMQPPRLCELVFERSQDAQSDGAAIRIPSESLFIVASDTKGTPQVFRTNEIAIIPQGQPSSAKSVDNEIHGSRSVEILGEADRQRCLKQYEKQSEDGYRVLINFRVINEKDYAFGAGQKGVYATAPGPSLDSSAGFLPITLAISFFLLWTVGNSGQPGNMVRLMAFERVRTMKRAIALLVVYYGVIYISIVIVFCCARVLVPGMDHKPDRIMTVLSLQVSEQAGIPWLAGLLMAAPFAAAMSTVDSFLLMISSSLVRDVYQRGVQTSPSEKTVKRLSLFCTVTVGIVVMIAAIDPPRLLQKLIEFTGGGLSSVFLFPVILAMYWRRFNAAGAIAGMLAGFSCYTGLYLIGFMSDSISGPLRPFGFDPLIWGFLASALLSFVSCVLTAPPPEELQERFFGRLPRNENNKAT